MPGEKKQMEQFSEAFAYSTRPGKKPVEERIGAFVGLEGKVQGIGVKEYVDGSDVIAKMRKRSFIKNLVVGGLISLALLGGSALYFYSKPSKEVATPIKYPGKILERLSKEEIISKTDSLLQELCWVGSATDVLSCQPWKCGRRWNTKEKRWDTKKDCTTSKNDDQLGLRYDSIVNAGFYIERNKPVMEVTAKDSKVQVSECSRDIILMQLLSSQGPKAAVFLADNPKAKLDILQRYLHPFAVFEGKMWGFRDDFKNSEQALGLTKIDCNQVVSYTLNRDASTLHKDAHEQDLFLEVTLRDESKVKFLFKKGDTTFTDSLLECKQTVPARLESYYKTPEIKWWLEEKKYFVTGSEHLSVEDKKKIMQELVDSIRTYISFNDPKYIKETNNSASNKDGYLIKPHKTEEGVYFGKNIKIKDEFPFDRIICEIERISWELCEDKRLFSESRVEWNEFLMGHTCSQLDSYYKKYYHPVNPDEYIFSCSNIDIKLPQISNVKTILKGDRQIIIIQTYENKEYFISGRSRNSAKGNVILLKELTDWFRTYLELSKKK
ncbi:hypothetical protein HZC32_02150 [Candidatus Woesearchaeota archaeon]|nr:hypothetical protein [Candidatus Woesearchaeota archaeon]